MLFIPPICSEATDQIKPILFKIQCQLTPIKKDKTAQGGKIRYDYVNIEGVWDILQGIFEQEKLFLQQPCVPIDGKSYLITHIEHLPSAQWTRSYEPFPVLDNASNPWQEIGKGKTYLRRYGLMAAVNAVTKDDDAQSLTRKKFSFPPQMAPGTTYQQVQQKAVTQLSGPKTDSELLTEKCRAVSIPVAQFCTFHNISKANPQSLKDALNNFDQKAERFKSEYYENYE